MGTSSQGSKRWLLVWTAHHLASEEGPKVNLHKYVFPFILFKKCFIKLIKDFNVYSDLKEQRYQPRVAHKPGEKFFFLSNHIVIIKTLVLK